MLAPVARASDGVLAAKLFAEGRAAVDRGDLDEGCAKLTLSLQNEPRVGTLGKLAECEEKRGHPATARARWKEAIDLAQGTGDFRRAAAEQELARLDRLIPKLSLRAASRAPNEVFRIDAHAMKDPGSAVVSLDPGEHLVEVSADGFVPWTSHVRLAADGATTVLEVPMLTPATGPLPHTAPDESPPERPIEGLESTGASPLRTLGIVAAGAGVATLGVGVYFAAEAATLNAQSNGAGCVGNVCEGSAATTRRNAFSDGNVATVLLAGGGALAITGAALWLFSPRKTSPVTGIHVTPTAGAKSAGVSLGGSF
jgi:hypothetical protein